MAALDGKDVKRTGLESHNGLSIIEMYHTLILSRMGNIIMDHPKADFELALSLSVMSMNDKMGTDGHVPSALLSAELPLIIFPSKYGRRLTATERKQMVNIARNEMKKYLDIIIIKRTLKHSAPCSTSTSYELGDNFLVLS